MPILSEKELTTIIITGVSLLLKPWLTRIYTAWVNDSPRVETFLIRITFGYYRRKARAAAKAALALSLKEENNRRINTAVDRELQRLGDLHNLDRVTLSRYVWTGAGKFPDNPTVEDFIQVDIYITNEWTAENVRPIMKEWDGRSGALFAKALHKLYYEAKGYISIGPTDDDDLQSSQNLFGVEKSWRWKLGKGIFDGVLVLSLFYGNYNGKELSDQAIRDIKKARDKIAYEKRNYLY